MAGNFIVINSKFKPFSYADMLQPVAQATQAHQALEDQYSELASKANIWDKLANESRDSLAYSMYRGYIDDLTKQASILASEGLTPGSRANMLSMKNRYSSEITPIENAYNQRDAMIKKMQDLTAKDGSMMYDIDPSQLSLDAFIKDPQMTFRSYSGNAIYNAVLNGAKSLSQSIQNDPGKWESILGGQYFQSMIQKGYTKEQILLAAAMDPNAPQELRTIMDQAIDASGIKLWDNTSALAKAQQYAAMGLWAAIGDTTYNQLANKGYNAVGRGRGGGGDDLFPPGYGLMYNTDDTKLIGGGGDAPRDQTGTYNYYRNLGYITHDGRLSRIGKKALARAIELEDQNMFERTGDQIARAFGHDDATARAHFRSFANWLSKNNIDFSEASNEQFSAGQLTAINDFLKTASTPPDQNDTPYLRGYRIDVKGDTDQTYVGQRVVGGLRENTGIYRVGTLVTDGENSKFEKGEEVSRDAFRELIKENPIYQIINVPQSDQQIIQLENGEQFLLPHGVLGDRTQTNLTIVNERIRNHGDDTSSSEAAADLNLSLNYISAILGGDKGYSIQRNDGTMTYQ